MNVFVAQINPKVGDLTGNTSLIIDAIKKAKKNSCDLVVFPELSLSGYPPEDFLLLPTFVKAHAEKLEEIRKETTDLIAIVGTIRENKMGEKKLFNSAAVFKDGELLGYQDKILLPTYDVFSEARYFDSGDKTELWDLNGYKVAITICEDIWKKSTLLETTAYKLNPIDSYQKRHPDLVLNLSASPFSMGKVKKRFFVASYTAKTVNAPVILCNLVGGNDELIFDGHSLFVNREGQLVKMGKGFQEDELIIQLEETPGVSLLKEDGIESLYSALVLGMKDYFRKTGVAKACLGISGGIDSAVVACIAVEALGKENVLGVMMPSRYSSEGSIKDAHKLVDHLEIATKEISIEEPFKSYLALLQPHFEGKKPDLTEQNLQARIRGMILMALSNKLGYFVLNTGNKSELAMGFCTLYGDMCGALSILGDVSKTLVYALAGYINKDREIIPIETIEKAPSAELTHDQKDTDTLPEYAIIDKVLQRYVEERVSPEEIAKEYHFSLALVNDIIKRIHMNEFKRRQFSPLLRVTEKAFTVGRNYPIVQGFYVNNK